MTLHVTFDTGALISLERRRTRITSLYATHRMRGSRVHAPAAVIAEWWRGRTDFREQILAGLYVEPVDEEIARLAGEAVASVPGSTTIDAIVMAMAARHRGIVYTSDLDDLERLREVFPNVRVLSA